MGSEAKAGYGAAGRFDGLWFDPDELTLETDAAYELFDERVHRALDEGFVENIMRYGVLQPVTVTKQGAKDGKPNVVVVDGRQRVLHAREANRRLRADGKPTVRVPGVPTRHDDFLGLMISANEHRYDDTPMAKARKLARYLTLGHVEEEAAIAFGVSRESIRQWKLLMALHPDVQKAIDRREVPAHVALKLSECAYEAQPDALAAMRAAGELRGQAGAEAARGAAGKKRAGAGATRLALRVTPTEVRALRRTIANVELDGLAPKTRKALEEILERLVALEKRARGGGAS